MTFNPHLDNMCSAIRKLADKLTELVELKIEKEKQEESKTTTNPFDFD